MKFIRTNNIALLGLFYVKARAISAFAAIGLRCHYVQLNMSNFIYTTGAIRLPTYRNNHFYC